MLQRGKGTILTKSKVAPAPVQVSLTQSESRTSSSKPNSFEKKLQEAKIKLKKVPEPVIKRSPIIPSSSSDCPICLENIMKAEYIRKISKCNHNFCGVCIEKWLSEHKKCPVCKQDVENE